MKSLVSIMCCILFTSGLNAQSEAGEEIFTGQLEIFHSDDFAKGKGTVQYFLYDETKQTRLAIHSTKRIPQAWLTGEYVQIKGKRSDSSIIATELTLVYSSDSNTKLSANAKGGGKGNGGGGTTTTTPTTLGPQKTVFILLNFQSDPTYAPITAQQFKDTFAKQANDFFVENSYNQASLDSEVYGWITVPDTCTRSALYSINTSCADTVILAQGIDLTKYRFIFYLVAKGGSGGVATIGGRRAVSGDNSSEPGKFRLKTINHELGHLYGLWHAAGMKCNFGVDNACSYSETANHFDTMGYGNDNGHFNAAYKKKLAWLDGGGTASPAGFTITSNGTFTLGPLETSGVEPRVLKLLKDTNPINAAKAWYLIENRQPIGFDSFLGLITDYKYNSSGIRPGLVISMHLDNRGETPIMYFDEKNNYDWELYPNYDSYYRYAKNLVPGKRFVDYDAKITVDFLGMNGNNANVKVSLGQLPPEVLILSPIERKARVAPNSSVNIEVSVNGRGAPVQSVVFSSNGTILCRVLAAPYVCSVLAASLDNVVENIEIIAENSNGLKSEAAVAVISTDRIPPILSINSPYDGMPITAGTTLNINFTVTDNLSLNYREFFVNDILIQRQAPTDYLSWIVPNNFDNASYRLKLKVYDYSGNSTSREISLIAGTGGLVNLVGPNTSVIGNYYFTDGGTVEAYTTRVMSCTGQSNLPSPQNRIGLANSFNGGDQFFSISSIVSGGTGNMQVFVLRQSASLSLQTQGRDASGIVGPKSAPFNVTVNGGGLSSGGSTGGNTGPGNGNR
jgi:hypothetical protein